jgi:hypothetical protein
MLTWFSRDGLLGLHFVEWQDFSPDQENRIKLATAYDVERSSHFSKGLQLLRQGHPSF